MPGPKKIVLHFLNRHCEEHNMREDLGLVNQNTRFEQLQQHGIPHELHLDPEKM